MAFLRVYSSACELGSRVGGGGHYDWDDLVTKKMIGTIFPKMVSGNWHLWDLLEIGKYEGNLIFYK
jgi:hypothetical protein